MDQFAPARFATRRLTLTFQLRLFSVSLINEALKKAQRQRAPEAGLEQPGPEPGEVVVVRKAPRSARAVALMTLGAGFLVIGATLLTYLLTTGSSTVVTGPAPALKKPAPVTTASPTPTAAAPAPGTAPAPEPATSSPVVPSTSPTPAVASAPAAGTPPSPAPAASPLAEKTGPATVETIPTMVSAAPATTSTATAAAAPAATPAPPKPSEQVQAFVDAVRVMGIRASGDDSRVLMNGRQYRLNDLVDRTLGVRLVKVEGNCLTFSDPNGVVYLKYF